MPRGFFTQSVMVLFQNAPSIDDVALAIRHLSPRQREIGDKSGWMSPTTDLLVAFRPEVHGEMAIDIVTEPWPDSMGDPQKDPELFAAWTMGSFGPLVFPGNLQRAVQEARGFEKAVPIAQDHRAFVRLRTTYVIGAGENAKVAPDDHDPLHETLHLLTAARAILEIKGALAYFDPNAEVIAPREEIDAALQHSEHTQTPPLELLCGLRFIGVDPQWRLMDTVGLARLGLPDLECAFTKDIDPNKIAGFLRGLSLFMLQNGPVFKDGQVLDGPQGKLRAKNYEDALIEPPRPVVRLVPDGVELPEGLA